MWTSLLLHAAFTKPAAEKKLMDNRLLPVLETVCHNLEQSAGAYREYLQNGNTFFYARQLMHYNSAIQNLLSGHLSRLPDTLKEDAAQLIAHYKAWTAKWLHLQKELNPADDDVFIFQNTHTFPKQAARNLEQALIQLKETK